MDMTSTSFVVGLLFVLRCLVPLVIMLGISYILRRLGYIKEPPSRPPRNQTSDGGEGKENSTEEGLAHGNA
jgi:hypothetical protein